VDRERIAILAESFDPTWNLVQMPAYGMGYHTRLAGGTPVHPTRESMELALQWALRGQAEDQEHLNAIIRAVIACQCTDRAKAWWGIWPWFADEPLEEMNPPDWNWADFIGAFFVDLLAFAPGMLDRAVRSAVETSLRLACEAIIHRNIGPSYTNICAMGATVTAAAGELLGERTFLEYGRERIRSLDDRVAGFDVFDEYNSPAYTPILIEELDRMLRIVRDPACRRIATRLHRFAWQGVARHFHPPTGEWAGPHARAYLDRLGAQQRTFLRRKGGLGQPPTDPQPCPPELQPIFASASLEEERTLCSRTPDKRRLKVWKGSSATLGSVSGDQLWSQRRPLLAHLREPSGEIAVFRLRVLLDGRDFASARLESAQDGPTLLGALSFAPGFGLWHLRFDRPASGIVPVKDLRVRFELQARDAQIQRIPGDAGAQLRTRAHTVSLGFLWPDPATGPVRWEEGRARNAAGSAGSDHNWFPTDASQGGDAPLGKWLDAVLPIPASGLPLDASRPPFLAFSMRIEKVDADTDPPRPKAAEDDSSGSPIFLLSGSHGLPALRLAHHPVPTVVLRRWRDSYWIRHPREFLATMQERAITRCRLLRRGVALWRRLVAGKPRNG
jgi:hypothetical protein